MSLIASVLLGLAVQTAGPQPAEATPHDCRVVRARYEIAANKDVLWVVGSPHLLTVVIPALDVELQARGWEDTVVFGDFTLCAARIGNPRDLTSRDRVEVTGYANLDYRRRRPRP